MGRVGPGFGSGNPPTWQPAGGSGCQPKTLPGRTRSQNGLKWLETAILGNFFRSQNKNPPTGWVGVPKWQPGPAPWAGFVQGRVGYPLPIAQPSGDRLLISLVWFSLRVPSVDHLANHGL